MNGKTYLSIDLDFWDDPLMAEKNIISVLKLAQEKRINVLSVMNHQQLLSRLPIANNLINIDYHSDLADMDVNIFSCGTWVSYVPWRREGCYTWIRNNRSFHGSCQGATWINNAPIKWNYNTDWKSSRTYYRPGIDVKDLIDDSCIGIGISISPSFSLKNVERKFYEIRNNFMIPYIKGRRNEFFDVYRLPV